MLPKVAIVKRSSATSGAGIIKYLLYQRIYDRSQNRMYILYKQQI